MKQKINKETESLVKRLLKKQRGGKRWKKFVSVLCCVVVFCTTYALILPAITMEKTPLCGCEEHEHSEECYGKELICSLSEEPHVRTEECYGEERVLKCGLSEEPHVHTEECYNEEGVLTCELSEEPHVHTEECYRTEMVLTCELSEEPHVHTDECYVETITCLKEEHVHTLACYSDKTAGKETAADWEATLPKLTGNPAQDMAAIANSQLDYRSNTANYIVLDEAAEELAYYNRYAAWYNEENAYCDWNSLFAAFCMHYANVENDPQLFCVNADEWADNLSLAQKLSDPQTDTIGMGDLLFYENDEGETLVSVVTETNKTSLTVVAGDILTRGDRTVSEENIDADDDSLLGFFDVKDTNTADELPVEEIDPRSYLPVVGCIIEKETPKQPLLAASPKRGPLGAVPLPPPGELDIANVHSATMYWKPAAEDPTLSSGWTSITPQSSLQGNEHIKLTVNFNGLSPLQLKNNGYKMHFSLPDGIERCDTTGTLTIGSRIVATLSAEADHRHVTITFDEAWVDSLADNAMQEGNFYITAEFDHSALDNDDEPTISVGGVDIKVPVDTTDLLARYGQVNLTKSIADRAVEGTDGKYYLTYTLTVEAGEHGAQDITVRDIFDDVSNIYAFNGVSTTPVTADGDGFEKPLDQMASGTPAQDQTLPGTVSFQNLKAPDEAVYNDYMVWELGDLGPNEVRTLTYTVQLSDGYTSTYHGPDESLDNTAQVFSKGNPRNTDSAHYVSENNINVAKSIVGDVVKNENGTYTIKYQIVVSAPESNEFPVKNVTVDDSFLDTAYNIDEWVRYDEDSFKLDGVAIPASEITFENNGRGAQRGDSRASFHELPVGDMEPGTSKTITYTAELAEEVFALVSGSVRVDNTAKAYDASTPDRKETAQSRAWTDITGEQWTRKFIGETLTENRTVEMNGENFNLGRGALQYQVIVNESGNWDMNQTTIVDAAVNSMLKIVGSVRVDAYLVDESNRPEEGANNATALAALTGNGGPTATKWITGTDGKTGFTQNIGALGFEAPPDGMNYAYVLTYYATPDISQMGSSTSAMISVGNNLSLSGTIIGNGGKHIDINTTVTSSTTVSNPNKFDVKKTAWYYEKPGEGISGYTNGALYWVIRVDGNQLKSGLVLQDSSNLGDYKNYNHDGKDGSQPAFVGAFAGALGANAEGTLYELSDIYPDVSTLLGSVGSDGILRELDYEIVAGQGQGRTAPIEIYYGGDIKNDATRTPANSGGGVLIDGKTVYNHDVNVRFRTDYDITPGESLYVVFRTEPMIVPAKGSDTFTYKNKINYNNGTGWVDLTNQAPSQTLYGSDGIQKTVTYPKLFFVKNGTGLRQPGSWNSKLQGSRGPYATDSNLIKWYLDNETTADRGFFTGWNIRVNQEGKLSGAYRIKEILPEGMELAYLRLAGRGAGSDTFAFEEIPDLGPEWVRYSFTSDQIQRYTGDGSNSEGNNGSITVNTEKTPIIYYKNGNEVIFQLSSFKANGAKDVWVDIQVITHVTDEKATQGQVTDFENRTQLLDMNNHVVNSTGADVTLALSDMIDKTIATSRDGDAFNSAVLPFRLQVNDYLNGTDVQTIPDLNPDGTTVNLVDEMSEFLIIDPNSVRIYKDKLATDPWTDKTKPDPKAGSLLPKYNEDSTADYKGYTVVITDGGHTMRLENLPDNQILTIFYDTTVNVAPGVSTTISNVAHWEGVATPSEGSSVAESFKFTSAGSVYPSPTLNIRKVDPSDAQGELLDGATFELTPVLFFDAEKNMYVAPETNSQFQGDYAVNLGPITGTTANGQVLVLGAGDNDSENEPKLVYHTVYKLVETGAPDGYVCDSTPYYFIIARELNERDSAGNIIFPDYQEYLGSTSLSGENVYVSYGGAEYTYTAYNHKGEIKVTKQFGGNVEGGRPVVGNYYFGLFDLAKDGVALGTARYTAVISYTSDDVAAYDSAMLKGETYDYKSVIFPNLELNVPYYLFETDANGNAISEGGKLNLNGESFVVNYSFPEGTTNHQLIPKNDNQGYVSAASMNNRYQATATKTFTDVVGNTLSQGLVGTYDFGIWKADESGNFDLTQPPLDKQSVVFRIQDSNVSEKSVVFKGLAPGTYAIYELDGNGAPVAESTSFQHTSGGATNDFIVHYIDGGNEFTIAADDVDIPDVHAVNSSTVALPMTGSTGVLPYQLGGLLLIGISLLASFGLRQRKRKEEFS